jgi:hypothetical protein
MPCTDGGVHYPPSREEVLDEKAPAMLCAIMSAISNGENIPITLDRVLRHVNWKEAGVTRAEFDEWWKLHQRRDAARRAREAADAKAAALRKKAASKLTKAEREALGVK